jgi:transposase
MPIDPNNLPTGGGIGRMLSFPAAIRVYLCTVACDMRRSFDGLAMMAEHIVQCNPLSGHLLVFCNKRSDRLKILYWDRDGWVIWYNQPSSHYVSFSSRP